MRGKNLLILAGLVLTLGSYLFFVERKQPSTDERRTAATRIFGFAASSVREVRIDRGGEIVHLLRASAPDPAGEALANAARGAEAEGPSPWRLTEPFEAGADRAQVHALLGAVTELERQRTVEGLDRQGAGLRPPRATVTITGVAEDGSGSFQTTLEIGPDVPASDSMLVAVLGSESIDQVAATLWATLAKAPGDWRDPTVLAIARDNVRGARITGAHGVIELGLREDEMWVEAPYQDRANPSLGGKLLGGIARVRAERFVDDPQEAAGADGSTGTIEIRLQGQAQPTVIRIGQSTADDPEAAFARIGSETVILRSRLIELLATEPARWRDSRWATLQVFGVHKAIVTDAQGTTEIVRQDTEWRRDGAPVDYAVASELLYAITDLESATVADGSDLDLLGIDSAGVDPLGPATLTIRLESGPGDDGPSHENLSLHALPDGRLLARSNRRDAVLLFAKDAIQTLGERLAALRAAPLVTEATETEDPAVSSSKEADP